MCYNTGKEGDGLNLDTINPFIRYARLHTFYQPVRKDCICYDCRLFYVARGEGKLSASGQSYTVSENTLAFLPPGTRYRFSFTDHTAVKIYVLNFDMTDAFCHITRSLGTATEDDFVRERMPLYTLPEEFSVPIVEPNGLHVRNYVAKCVDGFLQQAPYYKPLASASLKSAMFEILKGYKSGSAGYELAQSVSEYIRENYSQPELTNQMIAERFNYHPYHLSRIMKLFTGQTLHSYLTDYRLHMAKNYLMTTNLSVTMVSEKSGFASYSYFIKLFREKTGQSPQKWRQTHRNMGV